MAESRGAQSEALDWLPRCQRIANAPHGTRKSIIAEIANNLSLSPSTVRRKFDLYSKGNPLTGDEGVFALINRTKHPRRATSAKLPAAFCEFVRGLYERYQRNHGGRQVHRYLLDRWRKWSATLDPALALPGYHSPPPATAKGYPEGWSYRTICRLKPPTINLVLARHGRKAAHAHLPSNFTTRCGLRFGQRIFFDDQEYDTKVNNGINLKALRPQGFNSLDHLSGCFLDHVVKATRWDVDDARKRSLTQRDFTFFALRGLLHQGHRTDAVGTTLIFEHGTATAFNNKELSTLPFRGHGTTHNFDDAIHTITGGSVSIDRSGKFNQPMFADMLFRPQSTGNFRFKSPLESIFNLVRNHHAALPGATGQDRDHAPAELHGSDQVNNAILKLATRLPAERAAVLQSEYANFHDFLDTCAHTYSLINERGGPGDPVPHALEGWDRCGFVQWFWRLDPSMPWQPESALLEIDDPERRGAISAYAERRPFSLSPRMVADSLRSELTRLDRDLVAYCLPTQWAYDVTVSKSHEIRLRDPDLYPGCQASFIAQLTDRDTKTALRAGSRLRAWWHPIMPYCWITRQDGSYLGCLDEFVRPTAGDRPVIIENQKAISSLASTISADSIRRAHGLATSRQDMQRHNDRAADLDAPVTEEEIAAQRAERALASTRKKNSTGMRLSDY